MNKLNIYPHWCQQFNTSDSNTLGVITEYNNNIITFSGIPVLTIKNMYHSYYGMEVNEIWGKYYETHVNAKLFHENINISTIQPDHETTIIHIQLTSDSVLPLMLPAEIIIGIIRGIAGELNTIATINTENLTRTLHNQNQPYKELEKLLSQNQQAHEENTNSIMALGNLLNNLTLQAINNTLEDTIKNIKNNNIVNI